MSLDLCVVDSDGMTQHGYIAAAPGLYPAVRFQYRPLLVSERTSWVNEMNRRSDRHQATAEMMARKLVTWDVKNGKGETLDPKDAAQILRLKPRLYDRVLAIVSGDEPGDPDPLRPEEPGKVFDQVSTAKNSV